jgi:hypothetical protein
MFYKPKIERFGHISNKTVRKNMKKGIRKTCHRSIIIKNKGK